MSAPHYITDWTPVVAEPAADTGSARANGTDGDRDGPSFADFLDVINPLHHIPLIGGIYRAITEDTIMPAARLIGGTLYGGVIGLAAAMANVASEESTGQDIGRHALAMIDDTPAAPPNEPAGRAFAGADGNIASGASGPESRASGSGFASTPGTWYAALEQGADITGADRWGGP